MHITSETSNAPSSIETRRPLEESEAEALKEAQWALMDGMAEKDENTMGGHQRLLISESMIGQWSKVAPPADVPVPAPCSQGLGHILRTKLRINARLDMGDWSDINSSSRMRFIIVMLLKRL